MRGIPNTNNIEKVKTPLGIRYKVAVFTGRNRRKHLGTGRTLIEALMMRDWCREHGWSKFISPTRYIQRDENHWKVYKDLPEGRVHFGSFPSLELAQRERDLLIKCDWDWDLLVEMTE